MKKYLLIGALAVATMATAGVKDFSKLEKIQYGQKAQKIEAEAGPFVWKDKAAFAQERHELLAKRAAEYADADVYYAPGSFSLGLYEGLGGYSASLLQFPLMDSVVYYNYYGATDWSVNGEVVAENTDEYVTGYWLNGMYYLPETADHDLVVGETTYRIKGTKYGNGNSYDYLISAAPANWFGASGENSYLTLCAMECDTLIDSGDFYMVGGKQTGDPYQDGCGIHLDSVDRETTADTLGIIVDNRGIMKINKILFPIYKQGVTEESAVIPDDAVLRVAIFPWTEFGPDFSDTIAVTEMTREKDFVNAGASWGTIGTIAAKFYETDIFGETTQVPIWVEGDFYVQLTNFNESGCDFGIYEDWHNPFTATTVYQYKGQLSYRYSRGAGAELGQNLGVSFDAYWPTLVNDTTINELHANAEEGYAFFGNDPEDNGILLYTNVAFDDWEIETDEDWIEVEMDTTYLTSNDAVFLFAGVAELPEELNEREGIITVNFDGAIQEFLIIQKRGGWEAIENTKVDANFENKNYDVLGREVKEDAKGVIIRNGKKILR